MDFDIRFNYLVITWFFLYQTENFAIGYDNIFIHFMAASTRYSRGTYPIWKINQYIR